MTYAYPNINISDSTFTTPPLLNIPCIPVNSVENMNFFGYTPSEQYCNFTPYTVSQPHYNYVNLTNSGFDFNMQPYKSASTGYFNFLYGATVKNPSNPDSKTTSSTRTNGTTSTTSTRTVVEHSTTSGASNINYNQDMGNNIVATAKKYIGYKETDNSYHKFTDGRVEPWCADFVSYVVEEAFRKSGKSAPRNFCSATVECLKDWGISNNKYINFSASNNKSSLVKHVKKGDVVIFRNSGSSRATHTGIVESIDSDGTIHTIEGNTSDKVARREYSVNDNYIDGFVRVA